MELHKIPKTNNAPPVIKYPRIDHAGLLTSIDAGNAAPHQAVLLIHGFQV
jgi:hypothetical protein